MNSSPGLSFPLEYQVKYFIRHVLEFAPDQQSREALGDPIKSMLKGSGASQDLLEPARWCLKDCEEDPPSRVVRNLVSAISKKYRSDIFPFREFLAALESEFSKNNITLLGGYSHVQTAAERLYSLSLGKEGDYPLVDVERLLLEERYQMNRILDIWGHRAARLAALESFVILGQSAERICESMAQAESANSKLEAANLLWQVFEAVSDRVTIFTGLDNQAPIEFAQHKNKLKESVLRLVGDLIDYAYTLHNLAGETDNASKLKILEGYKEVILYAYSKFEMIPELFGAHSSQEDPKYNSKIKESGIMWFRQASLFKENLFQKLLDGPYYGSAAYFEDKILEVYTGCDNMIGDDRLVTVLGKEDKTELAASRIPISDRLLGVLSDYLKDDTGDYKKLLHATKAAVIMYPFRRSSGNEKLLEDFSDRAIDVANSWLNQMETGNLEVNNLPEFMQTIYVLTKIGCKCSSVESWELESAKKFDLAFARNLIVLRRKEADLAKAEALLVKHRHDTPQDVRADVLRILSASGVEKDAIDSSSSLLSLVRQKSEEASFLASNGTSAFYAK